MNQLLFALEFRYDNGTFLVRLQQAIDDIISIFPSSKLAYEVPSAGMAFLEVQGQKFTFYQLGDCRAYLNRDGKIISVLGAGKLDDLDQTSISNLQNELKKNDDPRVARQNILPTLRKHRSMMNVGGGYGALAPQQGSLDYVVEKDYDLRIGDEILLASDGFYVIFEDYALLTAEETFNHLRLGETEHLGRILRDFECLDSELTQSPRLKVHDDATAALIRIT